MNFSKTLLLAILAVPAAAQQPEQTLIYRAEAAVTVSDGDYAPLWLTANRYGMTSNESKNAYLRAGIAWNKTLKHDWRIAAGLDLAGGKNLTSNFWLQQAYADISWKKLTLSLGSKERSGFPLEKNEQLTSGWMVEGPNARPVPQIRAEIRDYLDIPGLGHWLALKGHLAYGWFTDGSWQEDFAGTNQLYAKKIKYHSKSLMFRLGNREKLPLEFEFGLLMATQFGGDQYRKLADGSSEQTIDMPDGLKSCWKAFFPAAGGEDAPEGEQVNVEGNMLGSWNFALNYYCGDWTIKAQLEHYFEDHSQMFWEYGRWKDGQLGIEITPPKNQWITSVLWEGLSTKDSSGPILYDGFWGSFSGRQLLQPLHLPGVAAPRTGHGESAVTRSALQQRRQHHLQEQPHEGTAHRYLRRPYISMELENSGFVHPILGNLCGSAGQGAQAVQRTGGSDLQPTVGQRLESQRCRRIGQRKLPGQQHGGNDYT